MRLPHCSPGDADDPLRAGLRLPLLAPCALSVLEPLG